MDQNIQLLVYSGSNLNLIKLSALKDDVMVHEPTEHILTGITGHVLRSLGTVELTLIIQQEKISSAWSRTESKQKQKKGK